VLRRTLPLDSSPLLAGAPGWQGTVVRRSAEASGVHSFPGGAEVIAAIGGASRVEPRRPQTDAGEAGRLIAR
jgi:hypothetical protein